MPGPLAPRQHESRPPLRHTLGLHGVCHDDRRRNDLVLGNPARRTLAPRRYSLFAPRRPHLPPALTLGMAETRRLRSRGPGNVASGFLVIERVISAYRHTGI